MSISGRCLCWVRRRDVHGLGFWFTITVVSVSWMYTCAGSATGASPQRTYQKAVYTRHCDQFAVVPGSTGPAPPCLRPCRHQTTFPGLRPGAAARCAGAASSAGPLSPLSMYRHVGPDFVMPSITARLCGNCCLPAMSRATAAARALLTRSYESSVIRTVERNVYMKLPSSIRPGRVGWPVAAAAAAADVDPGGAVLSGNAYSLASRSSSSANREPVQTDQSSVM